MVVSRGWGCAERFAGDLPEGAEVELAVVHDQDEDAELLEELEASAADEAAGDLVDFDTVIAPAVALARRVGN